MLLLRAKQRWNPESVDNELIDLFAQVHEVSDVGIRTACYAWMLYHLGLFEERESNGFFRGPVTNQLATLRL
jgi:hypothetical protein